MKLHQGLFTPLLWITAALIPAEAWADQASTDAALVSWCTNFLNTPQSEFTKECEQLRKFDGGNFSGPTAVSGASFSQLQAATHQNCGAFYGAAAKSMHAICEYHIEADKLQKHDLGLLQELKTLAPKYQSPAPLWQGLPKDYKDFTQTGNFGDAKVMAVAGQVFSHHWRMKFFDLTNEFDHAYQGYDKNLRQMDASAKEYLKSEFKVGKPAGSLCGTKNVPFSLNVLNFSAPASVLEGVVYDKVLAQLARYGEMLRSFESAGDKIIQDIDTKSRNIGRSSPMGQVATSQANLDPSKAPQERHFSIENVVAERSVKTVKQAAVIKVEDKAGHMLEWVAGGSGRFAAVVFAGAVGQGLAGLIRYAEQGELDAVDKTFLAIKFSVDVGSVFFLGPESLLWVNLTLHTAIAGAELYVKKLFAEEDISRFANYIRFITKEARKRGGQIPFQLSSADMAKMWRADTELGIPEAGLKPPFSEQQQSQLKALHVKQGRPRPEETCR